MIRRGLIAACFGLACVQAFPVAASAAGTGASGLHSVRSGENLSSIAKRNRVTVRQLRDWNGITGDVIHPGQKLRVRPPDEIGRSYLVRRGDTLSGIAAAHGTSVAALRSANGLRGSRILVGQRLVLPRSGAGGPATSLEYVVRRGDTLSEIAASHGVGLSALRLENGISGSRIHPGRVLRIPGTDRPLLDAVPWDALYDAVSDRRRFELPNGPYFGRRPKADAQASRTYREGSSLGPREAHRRAVELLAAFDRRLDRLGRLDHRLAGWHFVLDPGHGGEDPGAITPVRDGNGRRRYVVEDEYVYDVMMRVYALLRMHGAAVTPTVISPNHLVRRSKDTFVHERNEVLHDAAWNRKGARAWPRGERASLSARVEVARRAFRGAPTDRTVFLSFHADNDPDSPAAPLVLYLQGRGRLDAASRRFAATLARRLGKNAGTRGRSLHVLRNNPASVEVMIEVRNMAYDGEAWLLRNEDGRRDDARRIVEGVLAWAGR